MSNKKNKKTIRLLCEKYKNFIISSVILTLTLIIILIIPIFNHNLWEISKLIIDTFRDTVNFILILIPIIISLFVLLERLSKSEKAKKFMLKKIVETIIIFMIFLVPCIVPHAGQATIKYYEENFNIEETATTFDTDEKSNVTPEFSFIINFEDVMFSEYTIEEITQHKDLLSEQIYYELTKYTSFDFENYSEYEKYVLRAEPFEKLYTIINTDNMFIDTDHDERFYILDKSINFRETANMHFKDSENQRLIGCRHLEYASECYKYKSKPDIIYNYKNAITWFLISLQTTFKEESDDNQRQIDVVDQIVYCYTEIINNSSNNDDIQRAEILLEVFYNLKTNYVKK